jgi:hypothetical protein
MARGPKVRRALLRVVIGVLAIAFAAYAILLTWHIHDDWVASRALTNLESIQLGSPPSVFQSAVRGLKCQAEQRGLFCGIMPGIYRTSLFNRVAWRAPHATDELIAGFSHLGLRPWNLRASAAIESGSIQMISAGILALGREETLGAGWRLESVLPRDGNESFTHAAARGHWYQMTTGSPGEGYEIAVTPAATPFEMQARHINSRCLVSISGCTNLCAILPNIRQLRHPDGTCASGFQHFH